MEDSQGEAMLSREKARREEAWTLLEQAFNDTERVTGSIFGRVKGGFTVDLSGAIAFLPGSQDAPSNWCPFGDMYFHFCWAEIAHGGPCRYQENYLSKMKPAVLCMHGLEALTSCILCENNKYSATLIVLAMNSSYSG